MRASNKRDRARYECKETFLVSFEKTEGKFDRQQWQVATEQVFILSQLLLAGGMSNWETEEKREHLCSIPLALSLSRSWRLSNTTDKKLKDT